MGCSTIPNSVNVFWRRPITYIRGTLDHSTFGKCLDKVPIAYFADLFAQLHHKMQPQITPGTQNALKLRFVDATMVTLSAKLLSWGLLNGTCAPDKTRRHIKSVLELSEQGLPSLLRVCEDKSESAMYRVHLTEEQHQLLHQRAHQPDVAPRTRDRLEMVRLSAMGWGIPKIARHLGQHEQTVRSWIKAFLDGGFEALADKPHTGQKSGITPEILAAVAEWLTKGDRTWNARQIAAEVTARYGITRSLVPLPGIGGRNCNRGRFRLK